MKIRRWLPLLHLAATLTLLPVPPVAAFTQLEDEGLLQQSMRASVVYRTTIHLATPQAAERLAHLGIAVLDRREHAAWVAVDEDQLALLARLGYSPKRTDEVGGLIVEHRSAQPWLAAAVRPLVREAAGASVRLVGMAQEQRGEALEPLRTELRALSGEVRYALAALPSNDQDGDGLTDTEEAFWCTDPNDRRTRGNSQYTDKDYVDRLTNYLQQPDQPDTRIGGAPFQGWPPETTNLNHLDRKFACPDTDGDSVPDGAERLLGLDENNKSSDWDRYWDGLELFGSDKTNATMPPTVLAPGRHARVAAHPRLEVSVVPNSIMVERVATITTSKGGMTQQTKSYLTAKTTGSSDSIANTVSSNEWEESYETRSIAREAIRVQGALPPGFKQQTCSGFPPGWSMGCSIFVSAVDISAGLCIEGGEFTIEQCKRGVQKKIKKVEDIATKAENIIMDGFNFVKEKVVDAAGRTKDWIDSNLNLEGCSVGIPPQLSCTVQFTDGEVSPDGDYRARQGYSGTAGDTVPGIAARQFRTDGSSQSDIVSWYPMSYPAQSQTPTLTEGGGRSWGSAQTTTHTQYEETTITNGEAFTDGTDWSTATAADSAHAAELTFSYQIKNTGTDYARSFSNLIFDVYIGGAKTPSFTCQMNNPPVGQNCNLVSLANVFPGDSHQYTTGRIWLSLEQMRAIDLGGPFDVVVDSYSLGDDDVFFQEARRADITVAIEDGTDDGDETVDSYLLPTLVAGETVQDVIGRYFPMATDAQGNVTALWTPEFRTDTPDWCNEPHPAKTVASDIRWCKHALSTADWFNMYLNNLGDGTSALNQTVVPPQPVGPGAGTRTLLFRFNRDADQDGYSDRTELRLMCDRKLPCAAISDPAQHPKPELLAGLHSKPDPANSNGVIATLSLLNTGVYDAYGVEAVLVAPDNTISITNNTVGGSGRVAALKQVIVGSRILPAAYGTWRGTAKASAGGYYTDAQQDRVYTFTVQCAAAGGVCAVGQGTWTLAWSDDKGGTGAALALGEGYAAPRLLSVGTLGLKLAVQSGTVQNGDQFTVEAHTPRDTFQYTIAAGHETDYTKPLVIVSYNDPQGNHRFVLPPEAMNLATPTDNLAGLTGKMLTNPGVEIVTAAPAAVGVANATTLVVNNPTGVTLKGAHLFLEFIDPTGAVVREVPLTQDLPPGPNVATADWSTGDFTPAYVPTQDYIVLAFLTDYQGNILGTGGRPLSSFQADPRAALGVDDAGLTWDFGEAQQGTLLQRQFPLASIGYQDLRTFIDTASRPGLSVSGAPVGPLVAGDVALYTVNLNTQGLSVGAYEQRIAVRTSDVANAAKEIVIRGSIVAGPPDGVQGATLHPLDVAVNVPAGNHTAGEAFDYTHNLGPAPETLVPVKVLDAAGALKGVGKAATPFGQGTASGDLFGNGQDGDYTVSGTEDLNPVRASANGSKEATTLAATNPVGNFGSLTAPFKVLIHQTRGGNAGVWELNDVVSVSGNQLTLKKGLTNAYATDGGANRAQVLWVKQFKNLTVPPGASVVPKAWDGNSGGITAMLVSGASTIAGTLTGSGKGFQGGQGGPGISDRNGRQGESQLGAGGSQSTAANGAGGGGGQGDPGNHPSGPTGACGGGGGHSTVGSAGSCSHDSTPGVGAGTYGVLDGATETFGGGGGGGGSDSDPSVNAFGGAGGNGGGFLFLASRALALAGSIAADGANGLAGGGYSGSGGGGAGGSVLLRTGNVVLGTSFVRAVGGTGGASGGVGRIRIEYCDQPPSGTTNPPANLDKLSCYIADQKAGDATHGLLSLPDSFADERSYTVQYGRLVSLSAAVPQDITLRMPRQIVTGAALDVLVSGQSAPVTVSLDVGKDGSAEWTQNAGSAATALSASLKDALNSYFVAHNDVVWGATMDVPIRVQSTGAAQVLLTNLALSLQSGGIQAQLVNLGADRPLDLLTTVPGAHSQGDAVEFTHTLGPDAASIHPCKVWDQGGTALKGVGRACSDFGQGTASASLFGDGADGDFAGGQPNNVRTALSGSASAGQRIVPVADSSAFGIGKEVLIIQMQGTGAGTYEFGVVSSKVSGLLTLQSDLKNTFSQGGNSRGQVVGVPHFATVTGNIQTNELSSNEWDGSTGGVVVFRAHTISGATIDVTRRGFKGGFGQDSAQHNGVCSWTNGDGQAQQGTSFTGVGGCSQGANGGGGGGAGEPFDMHTADFGSGGGGGYGTPGSTGGDGGGGRLGAAGGAYGTDELSTVFLGSGGGGGAWGTNPYGGGRSSAGSADYVGQGGGAAIIFGQEIPAINIYANGQNGGDSTGGYAGGGGSGGSIKIVGQNVSLGTVQANGGPGGVGGRGNGGNGGAGRIRVEYCNVVSGTTTPAASTQKLNCYIADQKPGAPATVALTVPDTFANGQSYNVQFGTRYASAGAADGEMHEIRIKRQVYSAASLDALVSNVSGAVNLKLYLGGDATPAFDQTLGAAPGALTTTALTDALNRHLLGRNEPWLSLVDVPFRVQTDRTAEVMLTNIALTPVGAVTRFVRVPAHNVSNVQLGLTFGQTGDASSALTYTVDVGADGSVDWSGDAGAASFPKTVTSPPSAALALSAAINAYLAGKSGEVTVPLRIVASAPVGVALSGFSATPATLPDVAATVDDLTFDAASPTEGQSVTASVTLRNAASADSGPVVVSFFAIPPAPAGGGGAPAALYLGSTLVRNVPASGPAPALLSWNTLGFTGSTAVKVVVDPFNRVAESNETNNQASKILTILTRPDLQVTAMELSDSEPVVGETVTVRVTTRNGGQTSAAASNLGLFRGDPDTGGTLVQQSSVSVAAGTTLVQEFSWTPAGPGSQRLFARSDGDRAVNESDEGNNLSWRDVYVGLPGPLDAVSGAADDLVYSPGRGYGFVDADGNDVTPPPCVAGPAPGAKLRRDPGGKVVYRFDHLLPSHTYHLDLSLFECDGLRRQETVLVDGAAVSEVVDLGNGTVNKLSLRLDPAFYAADHTVTVSIEVPPGIAGAVVGEVHLRDVDYRYADSGADAGTASGSRDPQYTAVRGAGWLDGVDLRFQGTLPYQSARVNQDSNQVRYQFDGLQLAKTYKVLLTFWQGAGSSTATQRVQIDGTDTGVTVTVPANVARQDKTVAVPLDAYQSDGSITVTITRTDAGAGAFVNEIALEEETVLVVDPCAGKFAVTPSFTESYGAVKLASVTLVDGQLAPVGTIVQAFNPRGNSVGCAVVTTAGQYGLMRIYGEDSTASPAIAGMRAGELVAFKAGAAAASATPALPWQDDKTSHSVNLSGQLVTQSIELTPGWNLISLSVEPAGALVNQALTSIDGKYDRVLGDGVAYVPTLPDEFNTLKALHCGPAYYVRLTGSAGATLVVNGTPCAVDQPIALKLGWNWVGYLPTVALPVTTALQSIAGKYQRVLSIDKTYDSALPEFSTLQQMRPGQGYLLSVNAAATLVYPVGVAAGRSDTLGEDELLERKPEATAAEMSPCGEVRPTPWRTLAYGQVRIQGEPAPGGTVVEAVTGDGAVAGCWVLGSAGRLGLMQVYGRDGSGTAPGFGVGEVVRWRVNGEWAEADAGLAWVDDRTPHEVTLHLNTIR